ncbi:hypothetical protein CN109_29990, partial [Sinorhizobium meliloti]
MFSTPRLIVAAAALAVVVAAVAGRAATMFVNPSKGRTMKLAALRAMSALALTFALQGCGTSAPASA